jgi:hypothetical protein
MNYNIKIINNTDKTINVFQFALAEKIEKQFLSYMKNTQSLKIHRLII